MPVLTKTLFKKRRKHIFDILGADRVAQYSRNGLGEILQIDSRDKFKQVFCLNIYRLSEFEKKKTRRSPYHEDENGADKAAFHPCFPNKELDRSIQRESEDQPDQKRDRPRERPFEKSVIKNGDNGIIQKADEPVFFRFRIGHGRRPPRFFTYFRF